MSLNPRRHFDPIGGVLLLVSAAVAAVPLGWAKPTPVNPSNLRGGRRGEALVAAAGPVSNLIMATAGAFVAARDRVLGRLPGASSSRTRPLVMAYDVARRVRLDQHPPLLLQPPAHPAARRLGGAQGLPRADADVPLPLPAGPVRAVRPDDPHRPHRHRLHPARRCPISLVLGRVAGCLFSLLTGFSA